MFTIGKRLRQSFLIGLLAISAISTSGQPVQGAESETVEFRFAPPDGVRFVQTLVTIRMRMIENIGFQHDRSESKTLVSIRRSETGYVVEATLTSIEMTRDGKPASDPIVGLLKDSKITYHVGNDGHVKNVEGFAELSAKLHASYSPDVAKALAPILNEQTMIAREISEWNGRIGDYAGTTATIGSTIDGTAPFTLPNGESMVFHTRTWFAGREPCRSRPCVRVHQQFDTDPDALEDQFSDVRTGPRSKMLREPLTLAATHPRVSGAANRLIDPNTMLIYEEDQERAIRMRIEVPGRGPVNAIVSEDRYYRFDYE